MIFEPFGFDLEPFGLPGLDLEPFGPPELVLEPFGSSRASFGTIWGSRA